MNEGTRNCLPLGYGALARGFPARGSSFDGGSDAGIKAGAPPGQKPMTIPEFARWRRPGWQGRLGKVSVCRRTPKYLPVGPLGVRWRLANFRRCK
jgi:hypothetical protein